jgi:uncharacterized caspase-like protein
LSADLYDVDSILLADDEVTHSMWRAVTGGYADWLEQQFTADDLLIFLFSGHGVSDRETGEYYFVTSGARYADLAAGRYEDCIAFSDLSLFADVSCRKLVILDTCHSGAIQPLSLRRDLNAALRSLQDDLILTVTASEGSQEALEDRQKQLGRFTYRFKEAMEGAADTIAQGGDNDGVVTLNEVIRYVRATVPGDSSRDEVRQVPTAAPADLLRVVELPLTTARASVPVSRP